MELVAQVGRWQCGSGGVVPNASGGRQLQPPPRRFRRAQALNGATRAHPDSFVNGNVLFAAAAGHDGWNHVTPIAPVHAEISIQGNDRGLHVELGHTHQTGIRQ